MTALLELLPSAALVTVSGALAFRSVHRANRRLLRRWRLRRALAPLHRSASADGWVYLIGAADGTGPTKIGKSIDVKSRLANLQSGSPVPLTVLWVTPGGYAVEARLHSIYADVRQHGEWFMLRPADIRTIKEETWKPAPAPAPVSAPAPAPVSAPAPAPVPAPVQYLRPALTDRQRLAVQVLGAGVHTPAELAREMGVDRRRALEILGQLVAKGCVSRNDLGGYLLRETTSGQS
jgi:hypothetical protein